VTALLLTVALLPAADERVVSSGLSVPAGFNVSVFSDSAVENDIHCMTIDPKGRVTVSGRGYLRILVPGKDGKAGKVLEFKHPVKEGAHGLFWEDGHLWCVGDGGLRIYRDVDKGGIDKPSELLFKCKTGGEHTAHAVNRGPDGWLYLLVGDHAGIDGKTATSATSPITDPTAGCVLRFSPDMKRIEIVAEGYRNPYAMDWNPDGELFTFDSDNERCVSLPWYEPTRLYHVQIGGHHGWLGPRHAATWRRPPYFFDTVAPVATLGRGSPTGVACYKHVQFPERYRGGLFLLDWTFGVVHFVDLKKQGASYVGKTEVFARSVGEDGFAPTAVAVHPRTGDLFVSIGGRGTRGAVYRIRYGKDVPGINAEDVWALRPKQRSLEWKDGLDKTLVKEATGDDLHARRRALELIWRHRSRFSSEQQMEAITPNAKHLDPALRRGAAALLRALYEKNRADAPKGFGTFVGTTTKHLAFPDWTVINALSIAARKGINLPLCVDCVRTIQVNLGDVGASSARGTVWEGYARRGGNEPAMPALAKNNLRRLFPTGDANFDRELSRVFAMIEDDDARILDRVAAKLTKDSHPSEDVHYLIVLARLKAKRTAAVTKATADAVIRLDEKIVARKLNRDSNWPSRLGELIAGLAAKDEALNKAIVEHPDFGRPDHVLWTQAPGFDRAKAARTFLARSKKESSFEWNAALVALIGQLPAEESLPALRKLWGEAGLDDELLPILAKAAREEDHDKLLRGITSPRVPLVGVSLSGLEKLAVKKDRQRDEGLALIKALRQLPSGKENDALRKRLLARMTKLAGVNLVDADAALVWYAKLYPEQAKALTNVDGVDVGAWKKRYAKVDWDSGDAKRGQLIFVKASCATCHSGSAALGPDLAGVAGRFSRDDLFTAIVQPSKDVSPRYRTTQITTDKGKTYSGIIIYDAVDSLILQTGPAETVRLTNVQIASRRLTATSLMPAGLLDKLSDSEIADLYAHLKSLGGKSGK
jgi:putative heme-binding domain-containing protein